MYSDPDEYIVREGDSVTTMPTAHGDEMERRAQLSIMVCRPDYGHDISFKGSGTVVDLRLQAKVSLRYRSDFHAPTHISNVDTT